MTHISFAVLAALMSGCGTQRQTTTQAPTVSIDDDELICRDETPTGSHLPQTRCRRGDDIEREREAARRELEGP
jgi:hypothetical protein